mgnify:CR=1 FL=1
MAFININSTINELRGFGDKVYGINNSNTNTEIPEATTTEEATIEETTTEEQEPTVPEQKDFVTQTLDSILVVGNTGYEYCSFKQDVADKYVSIVNKTANALYGTSRVYDMLVPTSTDITMSESVRKDIGSANQSEIMDYIFNSFNDKVVDVNIYKNLVIESNRSHLIVRGRQKLDYIVPMLFILGFVILDTLPLEKGNNGVKAGKSVLAHSVA